MNRIILKIDIKSLTTFDLKIIFVDKRVLARDTKPFINYFDVDENFIIYSTNNDDISFTENAFKLPSLKNFDFNKSKNFDFKSEDDMKKWLKKLYRTLHKWNTNSDIFKLENQNIDYPEKINLYNTGYWVL